MLQILRVGMLDDNTIDVHLNNGNIILFNLSLILNRPEFQALLEDNRILYPKTDGGCVYWRDGPRLPVEEILELMRVEKSENN